MCSRPSLAQHWAPQVSTGVRVEAVGRQGGNCGSQLESLILENTRVETEQKPRSANLTPAATLLGIGQPAGHTRKLTDTETQVSQSELRQVLVWAPISCRTQKDAALLLVTASSRTGRLFVLWDL